MVLFLSSLRYVSRLSEQVCAPALGSSALPAPLLEINELSAAREALTDSLPLVRKDNYCSLVL